MNRYVKKSLKITAWVLGSLVALFLLIVILIQVPAVQDFIRGKAVAYLEKKIGTKVEIGRIEIGLPKKVIVEDFCFEGQKQDTLLAGDKIAVDISLFKLLDNQVEINSLLLQGITANVSRDKDSVFNFDYIIKAFDSGKPKDTTAAPMRISLGEVTLERLNVRFNDAITRNDLAFRLRKFNTTIKKFDMEQSAFEVPEIALDGLRLDLKQGELVREIGEKTAAVADSLAADPSFDIKLKNVALSDIDIRYDNAGTRLNSGLKLRKLKVAFDKTDIAAQDIAIKDITLEGLAGGFTLGRHKAPDRPEEAAVSAVANNPQRWKVRLDQVALDRIDFRFDDENYAPAGKGIDYRHLDLKGFRLHGNNLNYSATEISGNIASLRLSDKSGVTVNEFRTNFYYGPQKASLRELYLETPKSVVRDEIAITYASIATMGENLPNLGVKANLDQSRIAFSDLLLFVPNLENTAPFQDNRNAVLNINGSLYGKVSDLYVPNLEISGIGSTRIAAGAHLIGLPDIDRTWMDIRIKGLSTTSRDLLTFLPKGTLPENIRLPQRIALSGSFKGKPNNLSTDMKLRSSYGNAAVKGYFDGRVKNREKYDAVVALDGFDVGKLLSNDSIGKISLNAKVKGTGLDPKTAVADLQGKLLKAEFNGYTYRDLNLKGAIRNGRFDAVASMNDPHLKFDLVTDGNFKGKYPSVRLRMNLDAADLNQLNLHAGPLKLRGKIDADFASTDPDALNGTFNAYHFVIANEKEQFLLDSVNLVAVSTQDSNSINLKSQVLRAEVTGKYQLTKIGTALKRTLSKYYAAKPLVEARQEDVAPQVMDFHVNLHNDPVLVKLLPDLTRLEPVDIRGSYRSASDSLAVMGTIPRLVYGGNTISGGIIDIRTQGDSLTYALRIDQIENKTFRLPDTRLSGRLKDDNATFDLQIRDAKDQDQYRIAGNLKALDNGTEIHLNKDGLLLNYDPWNVDPQNKITIADDLVADRFEISHEGSSLKLQSRIGGANPPLDVTFKEFEIATITKMVQKDTEEGFQVSGKIDGPVQLRDLKTKPVFTSDLTVSDFSISKDTVGNLRIKVDNQTAATYRADVALSGYDNAMQLNGTYRNDTRNFDLKLVMDRLQLKSVQAFTFGALADSEGYLSGKLDITGTADSPKVNGDIRFNDTKFRVTEVNSTFSVTDEAIVFDASGIHFDRFTLVDEEQNRMSLDGNINTTTYQDFGFDLQLRANNFKAINSTEKDNDLFYGKLYLDTRLDITGDTNLPVVNGSLKIKDDTALTVVLPQNDPGIEDREGVVEFIDVDNPQLTEQLLKAEEQLNQTRLKGMNVDVNIEVDKDAELSLIIDKGNGDYLKLKGEARLNGGIDESGKTSLTGRYELQEGAYEMSFNLIKRRFEIQKGSYLLWTGEPTSANIDITAVYTANAAPIDLIGNQIESLSVTEQNMYKQRLPFQTLLKMNGELLKPEITFDIQLPDKNYGVASDIVDASRQKLEQLRQEPAELNKQVFALLLLNRFIGENPFASEAGGISAETLARQSVSKILSQQLNNLAGDLIKGFELDFGLDSGESYASGQRENRTDLNVAVSKKLLNDRLKVTVGSNFNLEGQQANEQASNIAGDVSLDYQLTRDGRYSVRAYRKNEYQVTLQGQVVETGVGFVITMDYNQFREIFHRSPEELRMIREEERQKKRKRDKKKAAETTEDEE